MLVPARRALLLLASGRPAVLQVSGLSQTFLREIESPADESMAEMSSRHAHRPTLDLSFRPLEPAGCPDCPDSTR